MEGAVEVGRARSPSGNLERTEANFSWESPAFFQPPKTTAWVRASPSASGMARARISRSTFVPILTFVNYI